MENVVTKRKYQPKIKGKVARLSLAMPASVAKIAGRESTKQGISRSHWMVNAIVAAADRAVPFSKAAAKTLTKAPAKA